MEMHQVCTQCRGRKKHIPLGFMEVDCNLCKGYGFSKKDLSPVKYPVDSSVKMVKRQYNKKPNTLDQLKNTLDLVID